MNAQEKLLEDIYSENIEICDFDFTDNLKGLYVDGIIAVDTSIDYDERTCILAEELGHHYTTYGNILDPNDPENRRQEKTARFWAHQKLLPLEKLAKAAVDCQGMESWELAEYLGVSDIFLREALEEYKQRFGLFKEFPGGYIYFDPLSVVFV